MSQITTEEVLERRQEFQEQAGRAFDRMMGGDGRNGLVTFAEREQRACELGDALTCRLLEGHLECDDAADPGQDVACPICGQGVHCQEPEKAELE